MNTDPNFPPDPYFPLGVWRGRQTEAPDIKCDVEQTQDAGVDGAQDVAGRRWDGRGEEDAPCFGRARRVAG